MSNKTIPAANYLRISNDPRAQFAGVDRQRIDTVAAADRHGLDLIEEIVDNDRSASRHSTDERPGWDRLVELAESGAIKAVVVYNLDRFTRNPDELRPWVDLAEKTGVKIHTTGDVIDLANEDDLLQARILLAVAEKEVAALRRRVTRRCLADAQAGRPHWSHRPYGYERDGSLREVEAARLRVMFDDVIAGRSATAIARALNADGVPNVKGNAWSAAAVTALIEAPRSAGLRSYRGEVIGAGTWEPIVSEDTWRAAVAAITARKTRHSTTPRSPLGGLIECSGCGRRMHRSGGAYRCLPSADKRVAGCNLTVNADHVDEYIKGLVVEALRDAPTRPRPGVDPTEARDLAVEVASIREHLAYIAGKLGRREMSPAEYEAAKAPLDADLVAAEGRLARVDSTTALSRLTGPVATLDERWGDLDGNVRARLTALVVERVVVKRARARGVRFTPDRLDITLAG